MTTVKRLARRRDPLWLALLLFFLVATASPQSLDTGAIEGTVLDPAGHAVAAAQLQLTDPATGKATAAVSDGNGLFRFSSLAPGTYALQISAPELAEWQAQTVVQIGTVDHPPRHASARHHAAERKRRGQYRPRPQHLRRHPFDYHRCASRR